MTSAGGTNGTVGLCEDHFPESRMQRKDNGKHFAVFCLIEAFGGCIQAVSKRERAFFKLTCDQLVDRSLGGSFKLAAFVVDKPKTRRAQDQNEDDGRDRHIQAEAIDAQTIGADEFKQFVVDFDFAGLEHGRRKAVNKLDVPVAFGCCRLPL